MVLKFNVPQSVDTSSLTMEQIDTLTPEVLKPMLWAALREIEGLTAPKITPEELREKKRNINESFKEKEPSPVSSADKAEAKTKRKTKKATAMEPVPYLDITYIPSTNGYGMYAKSNGKHNVTKSSKNPIVVAIWRDLWMEALDIECEKNYDKFEEVGEYMISMSAEELGSMEQTIIAKQHKLGLRPGSNKKV